MGLVNQIYAKSDLSLDITYTSSLDQASRDVRDVIIRDYTPDPFRVQSSGKKPQANYAEKVILSYQKGDTFEAGYSFVLPPSRELFARAIILIDAEDYTWTADQENNIRFGLVLADFLDKHETEEESLDYPTALYFLKRGSPFIFGMIPLVFFLILSHHFNSEDEEKGSLVYNTCLPKTKSTGLKSRFIALLLLALVYIFEVTLVSLLASCLSGLPLGYFSLPNQVMGLPGYHLSTISLLVLILLDYFLRIVVIISLGQWLAVRVSSRIATNILASLLVLFCYYITSQISALQSQFNPLYFSYQSRFLGSYGMDLGESMVVTGHSSTPPRSALFYFLPLLLIGLFFLGLSLLPRKKKSWKLKQEDYTLTPRTRRLAQSQLYGVYFEWRKMDRLLHFRQGLVALVMLGLFMSGMLLFRDLFTLDDQLWPKQLDYYKSENANLEAELEEIEEKLDQVSSSKQTRDELRDQKSFLEMLIESNNSDEAQIEDRIQAFGEGDSASYYQFDFTDQLFSFGKLEGVSASGESRYVQGDFPSNFGYQVSRERTQLLIDRDIPPLLRSEAIPTIYDEMKDPLLQRIIDLDSQIADHSVLGLIHRLFHYYRLDIILLVFFLATCGSSYAIEREKSASLCWLYTLPQHRYRIAWQKYLASFVRAVQYLLAFCLPVLAVGLVSGGFGRVDFPVMRYLELAEDAQFGGNFAGTYEFINLASIIGQIFLLLLCAMAFILAFSLFVSTFFSGVMTSLGVTILILIIAYLSNLALGQHPIAANLPFIALNIEPLVSGESLVKYANLDLTVSHGVLSLLDWTIIFLALTMFSLQHNVDAVKQDA
ncbi:MAG: hypothetical protein Q4E09_06155 [Eubacteriales bacterium]|nr:hypothetical protein [Eubacteriales bacterium]